MKINPLSSFKNNRSNNNNTAFHFIIGLRFRTNSKFNDPNKSCELLNSTIRAGYIKANQCFIPRVDLIDLTANVLNFKKPYRTVIESAAWVHFIKKSELCCLFEIKPLFLIMKTTFLAHRLGILHE